MTGYIVSTKVSILYILILDPPYLTQPRALRKCFVARGINSSLQFSRTVTKLSYREWSELTWVHFNPWSSFSPSMIAISFIISRMSAGNWSAIRSSCTEFWIWQNMPDERAWIRAYPFKCPVFLITMGLCCLSTGIVLLLVSVGSIYSIWSMLGGIFSTMGGACSIVGAAWCMWAVRMARSHPELYAAVRECEAETCLSEATCTETGRG